eukprot:PhF_6_TR30140/c0_g2_i3/m.44097
MGCASSSTLQSGLPGPRLSCEDKTIQVKEDENTNAWVFFSLTNTDVIRNEMESFQDSIPVSDGSSTLAKVKDSQYVSSHCTSDYIVYGHPTFGWNVEYPADWVLMAKDMNTPNSNNGSNS